MVEVNGYKIEGMEYRTNELGVDFNAYEYAPTPLEILQEERASKNDKVDGKADLSLLPEIFLVQVARAMMAGEIKYPNEGGRPNYYKGHKIRQLTAAIVRHTKRIEEGEWLDQDTTFRLGQSVTHLACISACCLMALQQDRLDTLVDNSFGGLNDRR